MLFIFKEPMQVGLNLERPFHAVLCLVQKRNHLKVFRRNLGPCNQDTRLSSKV